MLNTLRNRFVIAAGLLFCSLSALALPAMIDFESFSDSESVTNQIAGLTFSNATVLTAGVSLNELDFPPHSGSNVIVDDGSPLSILFDAPARLVDGFFTYTTNITMRAFDTGGNLIATVASLFESNLADIGDPGSSPNELISVAFAGGISRVEIQGDPSGLSFVLDDLSYLTAVTDPDPTVPEPATWLLIVGAGWIGLRRHGRLHSSSKHKSISI